VTQSLTFPLRNSWLADGSVSKSSQVIVLAEDRLHQRLVQKYLERLGHSPHEIRFEDLPSGRGCGEQWVRERYAGAVAAYRWRSSRAQTALVVAIDANGGDVPRRLRQLQDALVEADLSPRRDDEEIVHLIPRRNIETWIVCLNGRTVNEDDDYTRDRDIDGQFQRAAAMLFEWSRDNAVPPRHCVPSLLAAIPELRRLG
jgi:hypothetical protein